MKSRAMKVLNDRETYEMICQVMDCTAVQIEAMVLYALSQNGFDKSRLQRIHGWVKQVARMPDIFGKPLQSESVIDYLKREFGVDCMELKIRKPDFRSWKNGD